MKRHISLLNGGGEETVLAKTTHLQPRCSHTVVLQVNPLNTCQMLYLQAKGDYLRGKKKKKKKANCCWWCLVNLLDSRSDISPEQSGGQSGRPSPTRPGLSASICFTEQDADSPASSGRPSLPFDPKLATPPPHTHTHSNVGFYYLAQNANCSFVADALRNTYRRRCRGILICGRSIKKTANIKKHDTLWIG